MCLHLNSPVPTLPHVLPEELCMYRPVWEVMKNVACPFHSIHKSRLGRNFGCRALFLSMWDATRNYSAFATAVSLKSYNYVELSKLWWNNDKNNSKDDLQWHSNNTTETWVPSYIVFEVVFEDHQCRVNCVNVMKMSEYPSNKMLSIFVSYIRNPSVLGYSVCKNI